MNSKAGFFYCLVTVIEALHFNLNDITLSNRRDTESALKKQLRDDLITVLRIPGDRLTKRDINKCLQDITEFEICMKELLDRRKARWHRPSYSYSTEVLNQESDVETTTKYFIDLTRSSEDRLDHGFAYDYADFFEMARTSDKTKKSFYPPSKYRRYGDDYITKKILRTNFYSDSESDSRKGRWSDSSEASDEVVKPKRGKKDPFNYMQAPTRIYEIELDLRRRLPHFLPKRHHCDEEDFKNLRNYWIHGPQGKYPGPYRIPY